MSKLILGIATMNAGLDMPGSSLRDLLDFKNVFDEVICIDGSLTEEGQAIYKQAGVSYYSNAWTGSLKRQYDLLLTYMNEGDWWVMLDDDEVPANGLTELFILMKKNLRMGMPALSGVLGDNVVALSTPRVTCFTEDGSKFYEGEYPPIDYMQKKSGDAGPRAHIFKITKDLTMLSSPAGRHVVPYHKEGVHVYLTGKGLYHRHLKAPEMYVYNDCVKALFDHDIKNLLIEKEYRTMMYLNRITDGKSFIEITKNKQVNQEFLDFCIKYKDHGAPEGRLFIWYYNILHPELNPYPEQNWTSSLKKVLNDNWRKVYVENKTKGNYILTGSTTKYPMGKGSIEV